ncbi:MAG: response regulator [Spirochaetaceae bacterium]|jgi:PleD family two-component response regulator|nr:response regulator [Spirochaetaceae bacterium]
MADKKSILAIDDLPLELAIYRNILGRQFDLHIAGSAPDALKQLDTLDVDLIILDIEMPDMSGFEFLHQIRLMPRLMHTPVIIVSSYSSTEFVEHALSQGANDLMPKPVNPADLFRRIIRLVESGPPANKLTQLLL